MYQNLTVDSIDIVEPGAFGLEGGNAGASCTVFLRCSSDLLQSVSYKPDFPDSIFHITLYEGINLQFARQLLRVLQRFTWGFTVPLPKQTKLTRIEIGRHKRNNGSIDRAYLNKLRRIFHTITSARLSATLLANLSSAERLKLTDAICAHLHNLTAEFPGIISRSSAGKKRSPEGPTHMIGGELDYYSLRTNRRLSEDFKLFTRNHAIYLTPPELALDIVKYAVSNINPDTRVDYGDPAVGTGVFFSALLSVLSSHKINSAIGIEIDAKRVGETRRRWAHKGLVVQTGDYLHMAELPPRTLIVANPPYLRYQDIPPAYRLKLQERASVQVGMRISGQSSLYVYFLLLSHGWMKKDAVAAWLMPSEFMETNYGEVVRKYLTEKVELIRIHRFTPDKIQFENALVTSAVVFFRNRPPVRGQEVVLSSGGNLLNPEHTEYVTLPELTDENKWKVPWVRSHESSAMAPRIGDLFTVRRGIATGANKFFIMERSVAARRGIPEAALRPILPKARALETDIIEREQDGYPRVFPQLCLLDCELSQEAIGETYPSLLNYLKSASESVMKSTLVRGRKPWYRQEQREPPPFLCTYMGRGSGLSVPLYFIWNKSDAIASNTYHMLYPNEKLGRLVSEQPDTLGKVFALLKETSSHNLLANGRVYGGGLHKIEPKELLDVRFLTFPPWLETVVQECLSLV